MGYVYDEFLLHHQYSKNKIHCSCPDCSVKTSKNGYTNTDKKKLLNLKEQLNEEE